MIITPALMALLLRGFSTENLYNNLKKYFAWTTDLLTNGHFPVFVSWIYDNERWVYIRNTYQREEVDARSSCTAAAKFSGSAADAKVPSAVTS
jgi:hypothetical protein